jgi:pilus assembly protein CpaB
VVRKIRLRALLFLGMSLLAGSLAIALAKLYLDRARAGSVAVPTRPVVVAAMNLPIAVRLEAQHLRVVDWPVASVPAGASGKPEELLGQTVRQALLQGEPLLRERLATGEQGRGLAALLAEGRRAMAVKVDQVIGVAGFVQPGDFVDVITTMKPDDDTRRSLNSAAAKVAKIILQNIKVLAVGEHLSTDGHKPTKVQVVTLEVDPEQSEKLALASGHGTLQLTMRSRIDQQTIPTPGVTPLALLAGDEAPALALAAPAARPSSSQRSRRSRSAEVADAPVAAPAAPPVPVVEILRGTRKVEERQLRPSADSDR